MVGYLYVFGSGLLGSFFFQNFVVDLNTSSEYSTELILIFFKSEEKHNLFVEDFKWLINLGWF